jgi:hypothetical protein
MDFLLLRDKALKIQRLGETNGFFKKVLSSFPKGAKKIRYFLLIKKVYMSWGCSKVN